VDLQHFRSLLLARREALLRARKALLALPAKTRQRLREAMDLRIAAHALAAGATLVTNNLNGFRRVAGLDVVDRLESADDGA